MIVDSVHLPRPEVSFDVVVRPEMGFPVIVVVPPYWNGLLWRKSDELVVMVVLSQY